MRKIDLGGMALIALTDAQPAPADWTYAFARHAQEVDAPARLRWAPDGLFRTRFTVHALVQDERATLIDAGLGPGPHDYFGGLGGHLDREMAAAGLTPEMIDCVMFTHFHLDHIGWASRDGVPCFPTPAMSRRRRNSIIGVRRASQPPCPIMSRPSSAPSNPSSAAGWSTA